MLRPLPRRPLLFLGVPAGLSEIGEVAFRHLVAVPVAHLVAGLEVVELGRQVVHLAAVFGQPATQADVEAAGAGLYGLRGRGNLGQLLQGTVGEPVALEEGGELGAFSPFFGQGLEGVLGCNEVERC